jgi:hypothetical protein
MRVLQSEDIAGAVLYAVQQPPTRTSRRSW